MKKRTPQKKEKKKKFFSPSSSLSVICGGVSVRSQDGDLTVYGREPCIRFFFLPLFMTLSMVRCEWWRIHIDAIASSVSKLRSGVEMPSFNCPLRSSTSGFKRIHSILKAKQNKHRVSFRKNPIGDANLTRLNFHADGLNYSVVVQSLAITLPLLRLTWLDGLGTLF